MSSTSSRRDRHATSSSTAPRGASAAPGGKYRTGGCADWRLGRRPETRSRTAPVRRWQLHAVAPDVEKGLVGAGIAPTGGVIAGSEQKDTKVDRPWHDCT